MWRLMYSRAAFSVWRAWAHHAGCLNLSVVICEVSKRPGLSGATGAFTSCDSLNIPHPSSEEANPTSFSQTRQRPGLQAAGGAGLGWDRPKPLVEVLPCPGGRVVLIAGGGFHEGGEVQG